MDGERWRIMHRAVLDHLLGLVVGSPLGDDLVLRGSMVMPAWVGADAREPADLDWIVPRLLLVPVDPEHPYPYVEEPSDVQQWPEAADGADRYEIWKFEEFDTRGLRPVVPPEGLHWVVETEPDHCPPHEALLDLVRERPVAAPGVVLEADAARDDGTWTYSEYDTPGIRLTIPWKAEGLPPGEVRLDFARDEWLPESPVLTAIPRGDGTGPTVVRTAGRELSLAWKLLWLHADCATEGRARAKDLYDAVLLAEADATKLSPQLLRKVFRHAPGGDGRGDTAAADALRLDEWRCGPWTGRTSARTTHRYGARPRNGWSV
ncbi:nucleotidyl transferase AbiEii/AbiGii toxin family protein [Streptomyces sp. NBC_01294]|uniref:nucleotidyl transferase AbiEii/AbiGii toxin family protein n=1 Tax=Streptomyces sp. NBC_01294 TaxID=2903815 RepID=UPI002DD990B7|nr:nucleotidyl transferase AbiEii/AbiGii toxin family protein [Streptomyces sp. NBC_01294]WRZ55109.1 nucleotidyl transferase AbiEii/AbiGii toxin family protein [Streptomyces sp. NBC_01294]